MSSSECLKLVMISTMDWSMCPWNDLVYSVITSLSRACCHLHWFKIESRIQNHFSISMNVSCYKLLLLKNVQDGGIWFNMFFYNYFHLKTCLGMPRDFATCISYNWHVFIFTFVLNFRLTFFVDCVFLFLKVQCSLIDSKLTMRQPSNLPLKA